MRFLKDEVLWSIPICYWETQEPHRCVVVEDQVVHERGSVLVHSAAYGHQVYVERKNLFYNIKNAVDVAKLKKQINEIASRDEADRVVNRIWEEMEHAT